MQHEIGAGEIARNRKTRVHCLPVQYELIMVPTKAGANCPVSQVDQVLHKGGLFEIGATGQKMERRRGAGIKLGWIGDVESKILIQDSTVGLDSEFPFLAAVNGGDSTFEISFAKPIVLKNLYGSGIRVGIEIDGIVANHGVKIDHHMS